MHPAVHPSAVTTLLDPNRLRVAGALIDVTRTTPQLVECTGLAPREILEAIGDLIHAGLVERAGDGYTLSSTRLRRLAGQFAETLIPMDPSIGFGMTDEERAVLERWSVNNVLKAFNPDISSLRRYLVDEEFLDRADGQYWRSGGRLIQE